MLTFQILVLNFYLQHVLFCICIAAKHGRPEFPKGVDNALNHGVGLGGGMLAAARAVAVDCTGV